MARRAPEDVYETLIAAGFPSEAAVTMTAIAGAESGWDPAAVGDVQLQDANWGPSFGLFQIRTVKGQTNTGGVRDIARLATGDIEQARAAYQISSGGRDFTPWSVYQTGQYQAHLAAARAAAEGAGDEPGQFPTLGPAWLPWNWASAFGNAAAGAAEDTAEQVLGGARHIALEGLAVLAGLGVAVAGLWVISRGRRDTQLQAWGGAKSRVRGAVGL